MLVVVYTATGYVLLLRRTRPADFWQSVTGSLGWGESPMQAARRELYEETGIMAGSSLQDLQHTESFPIVSPWRDRYASNVRHNLEHWYALPIIGRRLIHLNPHEHTEYRWVQAHRSLQMATSWTNRKAIQYLRIRRYERDYPAADRLP